MGAVLKRSAPVLVAGSKKPRLAWPAPLTALRRLFLSGAGVCALLLEDNTDGDDGDDAYTANQIKAKRRALMRTPCLRMNPDILRAVCQYSDSERDEVVLSAPLPSRRALCAVPHNPHDHAARSRCFDYLVGAIDAAWTRYCETTLCAEEETYHMGTFGRMPCNIQYPLMGPATPASIATDDEGYRTEPAGVHSTDCTDYDLEEEMKAVVAPAAAARPKSTRMRLQDLKDRLTKAKYYLQDYVELDYPADVDAFWRRWDLVKYATVELVEDDDDEEIVEETIEDLERGRA